MRRIAANLWRVHWFNGADRKTRTDVPAHVVLPPELTGVKAPIVVLLGCRFPMIGAHKVLAAYACLVPRLVTGQFDPSHDRAVWPSTGNYCRGGVAISRILGCRGVAVLPAGMSRERFDWLQQWVADPADIIRTPGHREQRQGNLRQVRGARARQAQRHSQSVLGIRELSHPLSLHRTRVRSRVRRASSANTKDYRLAAFVSATGSAGTIAAGDRSEEAARHEDRRRRSGRMPDDALQRLRRAQHPGHRRQAHSAHPQCHEHRRRHRGVGCGDRCAQSAVRQRLRPRLSDRAGARSIRTWCGSSTISEFQVWRTSSPPSSSPSISTMVRMTS